MKSKLILICIALVPCLMVYATDLPAPLREVKPEIITSGSATLHWFGMHIYDVSLYTQEGPYASNSTAVLSIKYNTSVKRLRLVDTTVKEWKRLGVADQETIEKWHKLLDSLWPDVKSGNTLTAFKRKDGPTEFYFNEKLLGQVEDANFGPAFFAIWLDPGSNHPELREGLLGLNKEEEKGSEKK